MLVASVGTISSLQEPATVMAWARWQGRALFSSSCTVKTSSSSKCPGFLWAMPLLCLSGRQLIRPTQGDSYLMVKVDDVEIGNTGIIPDCTSRAASCWTQHEFTFTPTSATAKIGFQFCRGNR